MSQDKLLPSRFTVWLNCRWQYYKQRCVGRMLGLPIPFQPSETTYVSPETIQRATSTSKEQDVHISRWVCCGGKRLLTYMARVLSVIILKCSFHCLARFRHRDWCLKLFETSLIRFHNFSLDRTWSETERRYWQLDWSPAQICACSSRYLSPY